MESEVAGLSDFLSSELHQWLQEDGLDTCDRLLLEAGDVYEASDVGVDLNCDCDIIPTTRTLTSSPTLNSGPTVSSMPFAAPKTEEEIEKARLTGVPLKTQKDTEYCVRLWSAWGAHYQAAAGVSQSLRWPTSITANCSAILSTSSLK